MILEVRIILLNIIPCSIGTLKILRPVFLGFEHQNWSGNSKMSWIGFVPFRIVRNVPVIFLDAIAVIPCSKYNFGWSINGSVMNFHNQILMVLIRVLSDIHMRPLPGFFFRWLGIFMQRSQWQNDSKSLAWNDEKGLNLIGKVWASGFSLKKKRVFFFKLWERRAEDL